MCITSLHLQTSHSTTYKRLSSTFWLCLKCYVITLYCYSMDLFYSSYWLLPCVQTPWICEVKTIIKLEPWTVLQMPVLRRLFGWDLQGSDLDPRPMKLCIWERCLCQAGFLGIPSKQPLNVVMPKCLLAYAVIFLPIKSKLGLDMSWYIKSDRMCHPCIWKLNIAVCMAGWLFWSSFLS